jgi:hypothetical protein
MTSIADHVPFVVAGLRPSGRLRQANSLMISIALPHRNRGELELLLRDLTDGKCSLTADRNGSAMTSTFSPGEQANRVMFCRAASAPKTSSRNPSPVSLSLPIPSSPAEPSRRPQCPRNPPHQISNAQAVRPHRICGGPQVTEAPRRHQGDRNRPAPPGAAGAGRGGGLMLAQAALNNGRGGLPHTWGAGIVAWLRGDGQRVGTVLAAEPARWDAVPAADHGAVEGVVFVRGAGRKA